MTTADMKLGTLAPWFGGKRTLAPQIVEELGEHRAYWEPFCGGMAVLLAKPQATMETVNDLHGDLVNLARVVRDEKAGSALYRRLRRTWMSSDLFEESARVIRGGAYDGEELDVDRAYHYFVVSWLGRNGVAGTSSYNAGFCVRYTKNGGHAAKRFCSAVESIPAWRRRMRNVTILRQDGIGLLERVEDAKGVVIYADPPYLVKGASYVHDFTDYGARPASLFNTPKPSDHERMAAVLTRFKHTRVVVSYYDHPALAKLFPGWTIRRLKATKAMANQGQHQQGAVEAPEVLLINGLSYAKGEAA